jgi:3-phytase
MQRAVGSWEWHDEFVDELGRRGWALTLAATVTAGALVMAGCANEDTIPVAEKPTQNPSGGTTSDQGSQNGPSSQGSGNGTGQVSDAVARVETDPVPNDGDAADDPAIWVDRNDPSRSLVIGTDKEGGLAVYDLAGNERQYLRDGEMNNVDLRDDVRFDGRSVALVTAGNRSTNTIAVYQLDPRTRRLEEVDGPPIEVGFDLYGSCMYRNEASDIHVVVNSEDGEVEQWELLFDEDDDEIDARRVRSFDVGDQTEGCVADDELGRLYVGEESRGIWRFGADPEDSDDGTLIDQTDGGNLVADVEGLAIAQGQGRSGYLVASSQGDNSFVLYRRDGENNFVGRFQIGSSDDIDEVEETDGIDVTTTSLSQDFPDGLFVAQDGENGDDNQNFKLVAWGDVIGG